jgi:hypothetical protein
MRVGRIGNGGIAGRFYSFSWTLHERLIGDVGISPEGA